MDEQMRKRLDAIMHRLLSAAVYKMGDPVEDFLVFTESVAMADGHFDLFKAREDAKDMLGRYCFLHSDGLYALVRDYYALGDDARIAGVQLRSSKLLWCENPHH